jgi:hypothetical protein
MQASYTAYNYTAYNTPFYYKGPALLIQGEDVISHF